MTQFYQLGGAEKLDVDLAVNLIKRGVHVDILSMYSADSLAVMEAKKGLLLKGIPSVDFLGLNLGPSIVSVCWSIYKLRKSIQLEKYDIVVTSMVPPAIIASWAVKGTQARQVAGLHQVFNKTRDKSWQYKLWVLSAKFNRQIRYYAITEYVAKKWNSFSNTPPQHVRKIYNSISDDYFDVASDQSCIRKEVGIPEGTKLAIYVGRLAAYKGIDTIFDALFPVLKKQNLVLLYVGRPDFFVKGTKEMLQHIQDRIINEDLGHKVKFLPYRDDIPQLMASSDVLVHPSRMEGFGLTLVEAMAAGLPIVASNVEAIPEVLSGTNSLMVQPDDPKSLREMVLVTLNLPAHDLKLCIEKGRSRSKNFQSNTRADELLKLFEDVVCNDF